MNPIRKTLESWRLLGHGPRRFLAFSFVNTISWQMLVGSVLVLHGRALDLPAGMIGAAMSLTPFSMVLSLAAGRLSDRLGPRRLMIVGWTLRNLGALPLVLTPWVYGRWGSGAAGALLFGGVLCFCTVRSVSCVGWFPWLHEIVPPAERGRYFSVEIILVQLVNVAIGLSTFALFGRRPELWKFGCTSAVGVACGIASAWMILRIPGGGPSARPPRRRMAVDLRLVVRDRPFLRYSLWTSLGTFVTVGQATLLVLHLRDYLGIQPAVIMLATALGAAAAMGAGPWWGMLVDRHGSAPVQLLSGLVLAGSLAAFAGLRPRPEAALTAVPLYMVGVIGNCGFFIASNRGMLLRMRSRLRAGYSGVWLSLTSVSAGLSNVILGQVLQHSGPLGYRVTCLAYAGLLAVAAWRCGRMPETGVNLSEALRLLYEPSRPLFSAARACWYIINPPAAPSAGAADPTAAAEMNRQEDLSRADAAKRRADA